MSQAFMSFQHMVLSFFSPALSKSIFILLWVVQVMFSYVVVQVQGSRLLFPKKTGGEYRSGTYPVISFVQVLSWSVSPFD
jgi:hypothetical protein